MASTEAIAKTWARSLAGLVEDRAAASSGASKMLRTVTTTRGERVADAVAEMRAQEISMLLVGDHEDDDKVVGVFTEKCYKANVDHEAFPPAGVTVGDIFQAGVMTAPADTPIVAAMHDLMAAGARHVLVLKPGSAAQGDAAEGAPDASKRVSSQESVLLSDVAAVVSVRDMLRHLLRVHSAALKRAEPPAAAAKSGAASTEGEQGEPEGPAAPASEATKAAWEALQRSAKALDTQAFGEPVKDAADALKHVARVQERNSYLNCLESAPVSAASAARQMAANHVAALVVVDDEAAMAGIFTTRDFLWRVVAPATPVDGAARAAASDDSFAAGSTPLDAHSTMVSDVMTKQLRLANPDWPIERCGRAMTKRGIRHLPVVSRDSSTFVGLVSLADVTRFVAKIRFRPVGDSASDSDAKLRAGAVEYFEALTAFAEGKTQQPAAAAAPAEPAAAAADAADAASARA